MAVGFDEAFAALIADDAQPEDSAKLPHDLAFEAAIVSAPPLRLVPAEPAQDESLPHDVAFESELLRSPEPVVSAPDEAPVVGDAPSAPSDHDVPLDVAFEVELLQDRDTIEWHHSAQTPGERRELVGVDLASTKDFQDALAERLARQQPVIQYERKNPRLRGFDFSSGGVWGPAGSSTTITLSPQCVFRTEKIMATDTGSTPGMGTSIVQVTVGQNIQRPGNTDRGSLTKFFSEQSRANGILFDTANAWEQIAISVNFIQECTFYINLFGTAELS